MRWIETAQLHHRKSPLIDEALVAATQSVFTSLKTRSASISCIKNIQDHFRLNCKHSSFFLQQSKVT
jgi:hypothetical protein